MEKRHGGADVIELGRSETQSEPRWEVAIAELTGVDEHGQPIVALEGEARICVGSTVPLSSRDVGKRATVAFVGGDANQPIVTGLLQAPAGEPRQRPAKLVLDAKELELNADKQITLRCGKSSIVLTSDGRIVIRGENLLSRATAINRIRGGNIQLN